MSNLGYSIKMGEFDTSATVEIRSDEPLTWRQTINILRDLADQLEEDNKDEKDGDWQ